jgi:hypothetical protein
MVAARHAGHNAPSTPASNEPRSTRLSMTLGITTPSGICCLNTFASTAVIAMPSGTPATAPSTPTSTPASNCDAPICNFVAPRQRNTPSVRCCSATPVVSPVMMIKPEHISATDPISTSPSFDACRFFSTPEVIRSVVCTSTFRPSTSSYRVMKPSGSTPSLRMTSTRETLPVVPSISPSFSRVTMANGLPPMGEGSAIPTTFSSPRSRNMRTTETVSPTRIPTPTLRSAAASASRATSPNFTGSVFRYPAGSAKTSIGLPDRFRSESSNVIRRASAASINTSSSFVGYRPAISPTGRAANSASKSTPVANALTR